MPNLMQSFEAVWADLPTLLLFLVCLAGSASILRLLQRRSLQVQASPGELTAGGLGVLIFLAYSAVLLPRLVPFFMVILPLSLGCGLIAFLIVIRRPRLPAVSIYSILVVAALSLQALFLFAFIAKLSFPLYHDSATHFQIIQELKEPFSQPQENPFLASIFGRNYYHLGYHALLALLTARQGTAGTLRGMLLIGQMFLLIAPVSLALLARRLTGDARVFLFTALLGGLGWSMPAYAANWGKYPAIAALAVFPVALTWLNLLWRSPRGKRTLAAILAGICTLASILLHTRTILLFLAAGMTYLVVSLTLRHSRRREMRLAFITVEALVIALLLANDPELRLAAAPYVDGLPLIVTVLALLLGVAAGIRHPREQLAVVTFTMLVLVMGSISIPISGTPEATQVLRLLDRPFIQMLLYAPLAVLAALGLSSLFFLLVRIPWARRVRSGKLLTAVLALSLIACLVGARFVRGDQFPDPDTTIVGEDDLITLYWLEKNLPAETLVGIASVEHAGQAQAVDAGAWITPLIGLPTAMYPYDLDFGSAATHEMLCGHGTSHIYRGSTATGFGTADLETLGEWYAPVLSLPTTRFFSVLCPDRGGESPEDGLKLEHESKPVWGKDLTWQT